LVFADFVEKAAFVKSVEEAETHPLVEPCPLGNFAEPEYLGRGLKGGEHGGRMHDRLHQIPVRTGCLHGYLASSNDGLTVPAWTFSASGQGFIMQEVSLSGKNRVSH
jgi:hypothetical protein